MYNINTSSTINLGVGASDDYVFYIKLKESHYSQLDIIVNRKP